MGLVMLLINVILQKQLKGVWLSLGAQFMSSLPVTWGWESEEAGHVASAVTE